MDISFLIQIILNIAHSSLIIILISYSFQVIYKTTKFFHISHGITITFGAYFTYLFSVELGLGLPVSMALAIILSTVQSLIVFSLIYRYLKDLKTSNWLILIASLGVYVVLQNLISLLFGDDTKSFRTWKVKEGYEVGGAYVTDVQLISIFVIVVLLILSHCFIEKTIIGKQIKAVSSNLSLSSLLGISANNTTKYSFAIGSALASCAGILIAAETDMTPTMGFNWLLYAVVAMIIGGMGKMRYLILGALLLTTAQHLSAYYLDSKWMNATAYIILCVFLYFKPYGFSGNKLKKAEL